MPGKKPEGAEVVPFNRPSQSAVELMLEVSEQLEAGNIESLVIVGTRVNGVSFHGCALHPDRDTSLAELVGLLHIQAHNLLALNEQWNDECDEHDDDDNHQDEST